jgi:ubiquinone/menaquinone biosynthesis C-methylase UbiE
MTYSNPKAYEGFMGRWSTRLAPLFIAFAGVRDGQRILDVGCGTGSLARELLSHGQTISVVGIDPASTYVSFAEEAIPDTRARFQVGSAETLPFPDASFDAALSLLVLQDVADPDRVVGEMARVTRDGGVVAACQWDFQDGIPMLSLLREAAETVAFGRELGVRINRTSINDLAQLWTRSGLSEVQTSILELSMKFASFDDYWLPFLGASTPTSASMAALNRQSGGELARVLRGKIPTPRADGSFVLPARAWTVAGIT